ncbi:MAG: hypothetical protein ACHREM_00345 [Polyangiales bacterium]
MKGRPVIDLSLLGIVVHPASEWPARSVSYGGRRITCAPGAELHTTQAFVDDQLVEQKRREILAGDEPAVSLVEHDGLYWVFDGHHRLAAYRILRRACPCFLHTTPGSEPIRPPLLARGRSR